MPGVTDFGTINTCTNQADAFGLSFQPSEGVELEGSVVTCQIRRNAKPGIAVLVPTIATYMSGDNLVAEFSWTEAQSAALVSRGSSFSIPQNYVIEVDIALPDAPTEDVMRFVGTLAVAPGGNTQQGGS